MSAEGIDDLEKTARFAERLKKLRMEKGLSQRAFSLKINLNYVQYNRYEKGETIPSTDTLSKLADALDVSVDYLLEGKKEDAATANLQDKDLLKMFGEVEKFPENEKEEIKSVIDAYITRRKVKQLAS
jgi:transcriptional regulator with XRE-family HTH domain